MQIMGEYSSSEMLEGMLRLRTWTEQHGSDSAKIFGELRGSRYDEVKQIDEDRRRYSHYFHRIARLLQVGVVNEDFVKKVLLSSQVDFLLDVVEPLEKALTYYDPSTFDTFRRIYRRSETCHGKN